MILESMNKAQKLNVDRVGKCLGCGVEFYKKNIQRQYCNDSCRKRTNKYQPKKERSPKQLEIDTTLKQYQRKKDAEPMPERFEAYCSDCNTVSMFRVVTVGDSTVKECVVCHCQNVNTYYTRRLPTG